MFDEGVGINSRLLGGLGLVLIMCVLFGNPQANRWAYIVQAHLQPGEVEEIEVASGGVVYWSGVRLRPDAGFSGLWVNYCANGRIYNAELYERGRRKSVFDFTYGSKDRDLLTIYLRSIEDESPENKRLIYDHVQRIDKRAEFGLN